MLRNDRNREEQIETLEPITLLKADFKLLAKMLAKRLSLVLEKVTGDVQIYAIQSKSIQKRPPSHVTHHK